MLRGYFKKRHLIGRLEWRHELLNLFAYEFHSLHIAYEQALLFGWAKWASRERASEGGEERRACNDLS